jgi:hypothetical protein
MTDYLRTGWHEFLLPIVSRAGRDHMRIWIDMAEVVPILRRLDQLYGDEDHPYALAPERIPDAQRALHRMVVVHLLDHPEAVRRAVVSRRLAAELRERFGVRPSSYPLRYPAVIDQVDLEPADAMLALPFLVDREALELAEHEL